MKMDHQKMRETDPGKKFFYGYTIVGASLIIMSAMWGGYYAFGVFFKPVLNEFGWTRAMTSGAFSLASLMNGLLTIGMGWLTDRFGPRVVMTLCGLLLGLGFIMMSQVHAPLHFYLSYGVLVGAGMSGSFVPLISTVSKWFLKRRSLMTGIVAAGTGAGALTGPVIASMLIPLYGWRASYMIMGGVLLSIIILFAQLIKKDPTQVGQLPWGENPIELKEKAKNDGLSMKEALSTSQFWIFFATGSCYGYCVFTIMVHITPHAIELGIPSLLAAKLIATIGGLGILGKVFWGRVGDTIGDRQILMIGFIFTFVALICLVPIKTPWMLFGAVSIFGFGYGGITVSHSPLIAELFGLRSHGLIFGVFNISVMIGSATGPWLTGYLFDLTGSYRIGFLLASGISLSGIILSLFLKTKRAAG